MCMDGRLNNESLANISFSIDDTSEYRGEVGMTCIRESSAFSSENVCKHRDFTCATGPCTAYEKAGRLCAANMISPTWYECYYIPSADIPARTVHTSFPTFGLLLLL